MKGLRTLIFNGLAAIVYALSITEIVALIPPEWMGTYVLLAFAANMALRMVTTTPVGRSQ